MKTILISIAAGTLLAALTARAQPRYTVIDLGTLGGTYSFAYGLNNAGVVAGGAATASQTGGLNQSAFLWYGGQIINLGTLGASTWPACNSEAGGPNAWGESALLRDCPARPERRRLLLVWHSPSMSRGHLERGQSNGSPNPARGSKRPGILAQR
jgi:probable HAF family extracellular repeat protein